jgi:RNA polymerase sigma-70 factor, ECF subfamily
MTKDTLGDVTRLLYRAKAGDREAEAALMQSLYRQLHQLARRQMRGERRHLTLQPTALVNEAYLRLMRGSDGGWTDRVHFFAMAATQMRRIIIDHARKRATDKRGGGVAFEELRDYDVATEHSPETLLAVDQALAELAAESPRQAHIVELRFFGGLTEEEIAIALELSSRTVKREWVKAKAFLYTRLKTSPAPARGGHARQR